MARGIAAINLGTVKNIVVSWVVTLPAGAGLAVIFFFLLKWIWS
jgi:PiT family inorganic phosphate transporter